MRIVCEVILGFICNMEIYSAEGVKIVNTGRKYWKTNMDIKMPYAVDQYKKFMKGADRADLYPSYYSGLRKTVKWLKKVVLYLLNCALFNTFFVYKTLNTNKKVK